MENQSLIATLIDKEKIDSELKYIADLLSKLQMLKSSSVLLLRRELRKALVFSFAMNRTLSTDID